MKNLLILLAFFVASNSFAQDLYINEFMSANETTIQDEDLDYSDWIEFYNGGPSPINLFNYSISDNSDNPNKWTFPSVTIASGGHLIIFASGKDRLTGPYLHTNFKLTSKGEEILLTDNNGNQIDYIRANSLSEDLSYGRQTDGSSQIERLLSPSPNGSNNTVNSVSASHESGYYAADIDLTLAAQNGDLVFYTLDGSEPTSTSNLYTSPITMSSLAGQANVISAIPTSPYFNSPVGNVFKTNVIRYASFSGSQQTSVTYNKTFFIDPNMHQLYEDFDVLSIITHPENLFNHDTGIYVMGTNFNAGNQVWTGNYFQTGEAWERNANIQYFNADGTLEFRQDVGIRIHGGKGRNWPHKSLRFYGRDEYKAPRINHKFFDTKDKDTYEKIIARNHHNCWNRTAIKDGVTAYIARDLDMDTQHNKPVVIFINQEFWGVQTFRDYYSKEYFEEEYNADPDSINILWHGSGRRPGSPSTFGIYEGDNIEYLAMYDFLDNNSLSDTNAYNYISTKVDISNFIDYWCTEIYFNNKDWPAGNNRVWNDNDETKWRHIFYDIDGGWGYLGAAHNMLEYASHTTGSTSQNAPYATHLFRELLESDIFKDRFLERYACLMRNEFHTDTILNSIDHFVDMYDPIMAEYIDRWQIPNSYATWQSNVNGKLINFANQRQGYMITHISNKFNITYDINDYTCLADSTPIIDTSYYSDTTIIDTTVADTATYILENVYDYEVQVYPNPSETGQVWIDFIDVTDQVKLQVFDLSGKLILQEDNVDFHQLININKQPKGTYLFKVNYKDSYITKKVILN